jgi:predicted ester cyclase
MSIETAREAMTGYVEALTQRGDYGRFFTDDVAFSIEGTDQTATGRDAVVESIRWLHEDAFDARPDIKNLVVAEGQAAVEADFVGTHTGEFAGIAATGKDVRVPYAVLYDLEGDRISALRLYMSLDLIVQQIRDAG